jgi:hypothetical protein
MKTDNMIQVLVNWLLLLTAPLWVIPLLIYLLLRDREFIKIMLKGEKSIID